MWRTARASEAPFPLTPSPLRLALELFLDLCRPRRHLATRFARLVNEPQIARGRLGLPGLADGRYRLDEGIHRGVLVLREHGEFEYGRVVPVIRLACSDLALDRVAHDRQDLCEPPVGRRPHGHQRRRINSRESVPPIGLEPFEIGLDRLIQQATREYLVALFHRSVPAILVDAPEQTVGLAARSACADQVEQHLLSLFAVAGAVESEAELLLDE